jgi:hypothetical protein
MPIFTLLGSDNAFMTFIKYFIAPQYIHYLEYIARANMCQTFFKSDKKPMLNSALVK